MLPGAETKEWPANPAAHVVKIERTFQNEAEAALITAAENVAPDEKSLLEAAKKQNEAAQLIAKQWWDHEVLDVKIPFALTTDAIAYYTQLVEGFGKLQLNRYSAPTSHFRYLAKVAKHESFELDGKEFTNVSVVTLSMSFQQSYVTATTAGMSFTKKRVVVFDAQGKCIYISGDEHADCPIWMV